MRACVCVCVCVYMPLCVSLPICFSYSAVQFSVTAIQLTSASLSFSLSLPRANLFTYLRWDAKTPGVGVLSGVNDGISC